MTLLPPVRRIELRAWKKSLPTPKFWAYSNTVGELYESVPDSSLLALNACRELVAKQLGCAIGCAMGPTFCGVTGSKTACRWDITGAVPVRAARLMQHTLTEDQRVVTDSSLLGEAIAATRISLVKDPIRVRGTEEPIVVYALSGSNLYSIFRVLENPRTNISNKTVQMVRKSINTAIARCAVVTTDGPGAGQTLVCQRAAILSDLVPYSCVCDDTSGPVQLARSIAIWFSHTEIIEVQKQALVVLDHMDNGRWSRAHDEFINLLDLAVQSGLRACFVLRRIQFLHNFSISITRECLKGRTFIIGVRTRNVDRRGYSGPGTIATGADSCDGGGVSRKNNNRSGTRRRRRASDARMNGGSGGKIVFLGCHTTLYQHSSAKQIVNEITRSSSSFQIKIVQHVQPFAEEMKASLREACDMDGSDRWIRYNSEAT